MAKLGTTPTLDELDQFEEELRQVFAKALPPPRSVPSTSFPERDSPVAPRHGASRRSHRRPIAAAAVAAVLAAALVAVVLLNRSPFAPQPVLAVQMQPAGASLACHLPISALSADHTTGFIVMDHGTGTFQQVQTKGTTYIPGLGVWADVLPQYVAPDGRSYVSQSYRYTNPDHMIISITDAHGTRALLDTTEPNLIQPFAFAANGQIIVEDFSRPAGSAPGPLPYWNLKLLDPATGQLQSLPFRVPRVGTVSPPSASAGPLQANGEAGYNRNDNAIWYMAFAADGNTTIARLDFSTGQETEWFNFADATGTAQFVGTDAQGEPIIQVAQRDIWHINPAQRSGIPIQTMLFSAPHHGIVLNHGRVGDAGVAGPFSPLSATAGNSVWLASDDGQIWMYQTGLGLQLIAKVTTSTQGAPGIAISGPCQ